jgi:hypothetical protein
MEGRGQFHAPLDLPLIHMLLKGTVRSALVTQCLTRREVVMNGNIRIRNETIMVSLRYHPDFASRNLGKISR